MPQRGHFILHSNVLPQVTAGPYELLSEHLDTPFPVAPEHTHINVSAPRYTMPTDQILSSFPPANAEGAFGDRLPQIVLKRRTLPWERNPAGSPAPSSTPWLALVVVAEGEAELSVAKPVAECVTPGTPLLDPGDKDVENGLYLAVTETVVKRIFPCQEDLAMLAHVREVDINDTELANGDDDGFLAVVLANRLPVFDQAAGKAVRYMACLVNVEGQLPALPAPQTPVESFGFERIQDWRVLDTALAGASPDVQVIGGVNTAGVQLPGRFIGRDLAAGLAKAGVALNDTRAVGAALDGTHQLADSKLAVAQQWAIGGTQAAEKVNQAAVLARDPDVKLAVRDAMGAGWRTPIQAFALEKVLRFPVLAHWSFTTNEGATFETLMQDLDVGLLGTLPPELPAKPLAPGEPPPAPRPAASVPEVTATGHIGLAQRARRGDALTAWYRGPAVPLPTPRSGQANAGAAAAAAPLALAHASDQLRRVVPDGREDLSLAAAFEIGRLLALSQLSVVQALLRFRAEQFGAGRVREILGRVLPFAIPALGDERPDYSRFIAVKMIDVMSRNTERMLGPRRPLADPGRPIKLSGDLDATVAAGLGLDLAQLKDRSAQIGTVAALQASAVPVAGTLGSAPNADQAALGLAQLRQALQGALQATLDVAVPAAAAGGIGVRGARSAGPARDALDELLGAHDSNDDDNDDEVDQP
jgi:hypothetical protein